jgi:hypothetical protein
VVGRGMARRRGDGEAAGLRDVRDMDVEPLAGGVVESLLEREIWQ